MVPQQDISKLVERVKRKEASAQEQLYKLLYRKLYGVCLRYTHFSSGAEDLLQESFIKIFMNINQYSGKGPFEAWARRITVNTIITSFRKATRFTNLESIDSVGLQNEFKVEVQNELEIAEILKMLQELPPDYRIIFNLYEIEGYSHKEISEMLNINENTCRIYLFRSKKLLKEMYKNQMKIENA